MHLSAYLFAEINLASALCVVVNTSVVFTPPLAIKRLKIQMQGLERTN